MDRCLLNNARKDTQKGEWRFPMMRDWFSRNSIEVFDSFGRNLQGFCAGVEFFHCSGHGNSALEV
jgi:hypothetical protein